MDVATALGELSAAGSEQTRKTYRRHGAPEPLFGVSFATLRAMAKRIGVDHALAIGLWDTGNTDARCLAALIADPAQLTVATADAWASATRYHTVIDLVAGVVARSPIALERMAQWVGSDEDHVARCGWTVMSQLAQHDRAIADAAFTPYLAVIERRIHDAPNSSREGMNSALIAIGGRSDALAEPAIAAARRIGEVVVDHGDTACQTPDAASYIAKVRAHQAKKAAGKGGGGGGGAVVAKAKVATKSAPTPKPVKVKAKAKSAAKAKPAAKAATKSAAKAATKPAAKAKKRR